MTPSRGEEGSPASSLLSDDCPYDQFVDALSPGDALWWVAQRLAGTRSRSPLGGACPERLWSAVERARRGVDAIFREVYGRPAVFLEHGPARPRAAGSCVDHAHWHCLPAMAPIRPIVEANSLRGQPIDGTTLHAWHAARRSYVSVEEDGQLWGYEAEELPGQFYGRLLQQRPTAQRRSGIGNTCSMSRRAGVDSFVRLKHWFGPLTSSSPTMHRASAGDLRQPPIEFADHQTVAESVFLQASA